MSVATTSVRGRVRTIERSKDHYIKAKRNGCSSPSVGSSRRFARAAAAQAKALRLGCASWTRMLRSVVALLLSLAGLAAGGVPPRNFDAPSPSSISICVVIFPPFILPSAWRSLAWYDLYSALPGFAGPLTGQVYTGANATAIDGAFRAVSSSVRQQTV